MKRILFTIVLTTMLCSTSASESRPSWLHIGYTKTASFLSAATRRTGSFLTTLAAYFPPVARKRRFEQQIAQLDIVILTLDQQDKDSRAYFEKIEKMTSTAEQKASPSKSVKKPLQPIIVEIAEDNYDGNGSCMFNYSAPSDLPAAALQHSSKQAHRKLSTRDSLRNILAKIKKENPEEPRSSTYLLPARIQAALGYLGDCVQENVNTYQQIIDSERIISITIPYEGIDTQESQLITNPYKLQEYVCPAYGKSMTRTIDYKDIPLICGLTKKGKRYKDAEDFFINNPETEGYKLYTLLRSPKEIEKRKLNHKNVQETYEEHKKNIQFFDRKKAQAYCDEENHSDLLNDYIIQQKKFMEENQEFRKGFLKENGKPHEGWLDILTRDKTALEQQKKQSEKRWYL